MILAKGGQRVGNLVVGVRVVVPPFVKGVLRLSRFLCTKKRGKKCGSGGREGLKKKQANGENQHTQRTNAKKMVVECENKRKKV